MYDIERRKELTGRTVFDLIVALSEMPPDAMVSCCGDSNVWLHVEDDDSLVCVDVESLDDTYATQEQTPVFIVVPTKSRGDRRRRDRTKSLRKRNISMQYFGSTPYYSNLHQFSKGKIHCSCPICSHKTHQKGQRNNWKHSDEKRIQAALYGIEELVCEGDDFE